MTFEYPVPLTPDEVAFRDDVREFISEHLLPEWRGVSELWSRTDLDALSGWTREMVRTGWAIPDWPTEYGGAPLTVMQRYIVSRETAVARAPLIPHVNLHMVGPLIFRYGTAWQKSYFLPRILDASDYWSQGFSEPGAGSDLAALRTTAVRAGDDFVINGQKIWTTSAHFATELLCLVRTDPSAARRQDGISILLVPLDAAGVTVRPIRTIDGVHHLNEVFFEDAVVSIDRLLGEENRGWTYAREMLAWERESIADVNPTKVIFEDVVRVARDYRRLDDPLFRQRVVETEFRLDALEMMELRALRSADLGTEAGYEPSLLKILGSTLRQEVLQLGREALGGLGAVMPGDGVPQSPSGLGSHLVTDVLLYRAASIYGGTNEIQHDVAASQVLVPRSGSR